MEMHEYKGVIHAHTLYSDGSGTVDDLVQAARLARLDFLAITDHNAFHPEEAGWRDGVLVIMGEEIDDDEGKEIKGGHLLALGIREDMAPLRHDFQQLIDRIGELGGVSFLAHPQERNSRYMPDTFSWRDWSVRGYTGIELWNLLSEFRGYTTSIPRMLAIAFFPQWFTQGPWPEVLSLWERLIAEQRRPVVAIGGADAHAQTHRLGPLKRKFMPYVTAFRSVTTHLLTDSPLVGENAAADERVLLAAMRAGHAWIGYERLGSTDGFRFWGVRGDQGWVMGDGALAGPMTLHVTTPGPGDIRLLYNGQVIAQTFGNNLTKNVTEPGTYRVEVWRRRWGKPRGWIFSNPIYLWEASDSTEPAPSRRQSR